VVLSHRSLLQEVIFHIRIPYHLCYEPSACGDGYPDDAMWLEWSGTNERALFDQVFRIFFDFSNFSELARLRAS
jgi:hypothetical protein